MAGPSGGSFLEHVLGVLTGSPRTPAQRGEYHQMSHELRARLAKVADQAASQHLASLPSEAARQRAYSQMMANPKAIRHLIESDERLQAMSRSIKRKFNVDVTPDWLSGGEPIRLEPVDTREGVI